MINYTTTFINYFILVNFQLCFRRLVCLIFSKARYKRKLTQLIEYLVFEGIFFNTKDYKTLRNMILL